MMTKIIGLVLYLVFAAVWFLPLFLRHRKTVKEPIWFYPLTLALGMLSCLPALGIQNGISFLLGKITPAVADNAFLTALIGALFVLISVAVTEELCKFALGNFGVRWVPNLTETGCMLILGMAGLGFGIVENLNSESVYSGVLNGVLCMHLFLQMWMGRYLWRAWNAKKQQNKKGYASNLLLAFLIPICVHFVFDYCLMRGSGLIPKGQAVLGVVMVSTAFAVAAVYIIMMLVTTHKQVKKEIAAAKQ